MASREQGAAARTASSYPALAVVPGGPLDAEPLRERTAAVIDLGSNSWRLVVYRYVPHGAWRITGQLQEPVRIAEGLSASGRLGAGAIARGLDTLDMFARYCRARGIEPDAVDAVATSAIRDATNRDDLLSPARELTGPAIRVLSAQEEAHYGYLAAVNSTTLSDGTVLDLGGGSLQLLEVRDRHARTFGSWPLGAVRVSEGLLPRGRALSRKELKRARAAVASQLADAAWLGDTGPRVVAMGGAVRNLATAAQRARGAAMTGIQGYVLGAGELRELVGTLARRSATSRRSPGSSPRAPISSWAPRSRSRRCSIAAGSTASRSRARACAKACSSRPACSTGQRRWSPTCAPRRCATSRTNAAPTWSTPSTSHSSRCRCTTRSQA